MLVLVGALRGQRQELTERRLLRHRVDERVVDHRQPVDPARLVGVDHDLDAADQVLDARMLADVLHRRHDVAAMAAEERLRLASDQTELDLHARVVMALHVRHQRAEEVDVEPAAQPLVGGDHHVADALDAPLLHVHRAVFGVRVGEMADHLPDPVRVGPALRHALLGAAHLRGRHHLHGAGDLLRVLHALDLGADFLADCHRGIPSAAHQVCVCLKVSIALRI